MTTQLEHVLSLVLLWHFVSKRLDSLPLDGTLDRHVRITSSASLPIFPILINRPMLSPITAPGTVEMPMAPMDGPLANALVWSSSQTMDSASTPSEIACQSLNPVRFSPRECVFNARIRDKKQRGLEAIVPVCPQSSQMARWGLVPGATAWDIVTTDVPEDHWERRGWTAYPRDLSYQNPFEDTPSPAVPPAEPVAPLEYDYNYWETDAAWNAWYAQSVLSETPGQTIGGVEIGLAASSDCYDPEQSRSSIERGAPSSEATPVNKAIPSGQRDLESAELQVATKSASSGQRDLGRKKQRTLEAYKNQTFRNMTEKIAPNNAEKVTQKKYHSTYIKACVDVWVSPSTGCISADPIRMQEIPWRHSGIVRSASAPSGTMTW